MRQSRCERKDRDELGSKESGLSRRLRLGQGLCGEESFGSPLFHKGMCSCLWSHRRHKLIRTHFTNPYSVFSFSRETTVILAMTLSYRRSESCASFTLQGSVPALRTAPTCMISLAATSAGFALGCCSWGLSGQPSFCPFYPLSELFTSSPEEAHIFYSPSVENLRELALELKQC